MFLVLESLTVVLLIIDSSWFLLAVAVIVAAVAVPPSPQLRMPSSLSGIVPGCTKTYAAVYAAVYAAALGYAAMGYLSWKFKALDQYLGDG